MTVVGVEFQDMTCTRASVLVVARKDMTVVVFC